MRRFGYEGHEANRKMWAEKKRKAKAKLLTAVKMGLTRTGPKIDPADGGTPEAPAHVESPMNLNDFRLSEKDKAIKKERVRKMSGKIAGLW